MIAYILGVIAIAISVAHLANKYQAKWQVKDDETRLLEDTNRFLAGWSKYEERTDETFNRVTCEAEALVARQRERIAAEEASADAISDDDLIAASASLLHRAAIYSGPREEPVVYDQKKLDKAMFKGVEESKARRGILSMSDELHG